MSNKSKIYQLKVTDPLKEYKNSLNMLEKCIEVVFGKIAENCLTIRENSVSLWIKYF